MRVLEGVSAFAYLALGFRYVFSHVYPEIVRDEFKKLEKVYNNAIGRWEEIKVRDKPEGTWDDVVRAAGWSFIWMWVWPAWMLLHAGDHARGQITKHNAHDVATKLTMTKRSPHIKRIDAELREIHIKQLERDTGIEKPEER
jgi:hypothetical protein